MSVIWIFGNTFIFFGNDGCRNETHVSVQPRSLDGPRLGLVVWVTRLIWLQLREITQLWKMLAREWSAAKAQFAVLFGDRFEVNR